MNLLRTRLILSFIVAVSFYSTHSYAAKASPQRVVDKPISLELKNLTHWKHSREALAIKQSLKALVTPPPSYPRVANPFESYQSLYHKPFLVLEAEPADFGGFYALLVFKGHTKVLSLWVYEIDKDVFEIREIEPLQVDLNKVIMNELDDTRLKPFWMTL